MMQIVQAVDRLVSAINKLMLFVGSLALVAAAVILSYSVVSRGLFQATTDWQDEASVFCLVGATFLCGAYVQEIQPLARFHQPSIRLAHPMKIHMGHNYRQCGHHHGATFQTF